MGKELAETDSLDHAARVAGWAVRNLRRFRWSRKIEIGLKDRYLSNFAEALHQSGIHGIRNFALELLSAQSPDPHDIHTFDAAVEMCGACGYVVSGFLELSPVEINCCLKGITDDNGERNVVTWARDKVAEGRPTGSNDVHPVEGNTVWSALTGGYDGITHWKRHKAFTCNNLEKHHPGRFKCTREDWHTFYRAAVVYPLQYRTRRNADRVIFGFLCFDSEKPGIFVGIPDIFDYADNQSDYYSQLERSTVFHTGAILADALSMFLRPFYEEQKQVLISSSSEEDCNAVENE